MTEHLDRFRTMRLRVEHREGLSELYAEGRFVGEISHTSFAPLAYIDKWFAEEIVRRWNMFDELVGALDQVQGAAATIPGLADEIGKLLARARKIGEAK